MTRFGVWRAAVWFAATAGLLATLAWVGAHLLTQGWPAAEPVVLVGAVAGPASLWLAARLARVQPFELRWDGRSWHLGRPAAPGADPIVGDLHVAVDLGGWLLLRFRTEWPPGERRRYWLPLQRRGLEAAWHGLRCAVYSPRPATRCKPLMATSDTTPPP